VHETFALAEAAAAHRLMESSAHIGKIVLTLG
jgi:NADPH2:quinone reductase